MKIEDSFEKANDQTQVSPVILKDKAPWTNGHPYDARNPKEFYMKWVKPTNLMAACEITNQQGKKPMKLMNELAHSQ